MATSKEFMEYIIDQVGRAVGVDNISARKMFGEYALYYLGTTVGLICDNTLFVKVTPVTTELLSKHETGIPYPGAKPWYQIDESDLDNQELITQLLEAQYERIASSSKKHKQSI